MSKEWNEEIDDFCDHLHAIAETVKSSDPYGTDDVDDGIFCDECAPKNAYNLNTGGAYDSDSQEFCQKCGMILDHFFTDYGAMDELGYSADENGPIDNQEAFTLLNVIDSGVPKLSCVFDSEPDSPNDEPAKALIRRIINRSQEEAKT
jgi:hypothetical protein